MRNGDDRMSLVKLEPLHNDKNIAQRCFTAMIEEKQLKVKKVQNLLLRQEDLQIAKT
jgi:hypothetical protein